MKKFIYLILSFTLLTFVACEDDDKNPKKEEVKVLSADVDATSRTTWNYYSLKNSKIVGVGEENEADNKAWFNRTDWDIAIKRYEIRTNSGLAATAGGKGGVYTCAEGVTFESLEKTPANATFKADEAVTKITHAGEITEIMSTAQVIQFKKNADGSIAMPPVYLQSPVYIFKSADGNDNYKLNFKQYKNADGVSGNIKFEYAKIK